MKLKKCKICEPFVYTLKDSCPKCNGETINPAYKFLKNEKGTISDNREK